VRILQVANFVTSTSGGQRVALDQLARGYQAAGHVCGRLVPGEEPSVQLVDGVYIHVVAGPRLPLSGGYRVAVSRRSVEQAVAEFAPDVIELSDRTTLAWLPEWAQGAGIPTVHFTHECVERVIVDRSALLRLGKPVVRRWRSRVAEHCAAIVAASRYAAAEFDGLHPLVAVVPLGVDRSVFNPAAAGRPSDDEPYVLFAGRLSSEKRPDVVLDAVRLLAEQGRPVRLLVAGSGPMQERLERDSTGLDVRFLGHVGDRLRLASLMARASVVAAPSPFETFGLTVAEAMSCGTPVVVADTSGGAELLAEGCGLAVPPFATEVARAIDELLRRDLSVTRAACVVRSAAFSWDESARRMLDVFARVRVPGEVAAA